MRMGLELRLEQHLEQRLECTLELRQELVDPFETARRLFEESPKVDVPIELGRYTIIVKAAIIGEKDLKSMFEKERFAGIMARWDERYQFLNRELKVPTMIPMRRTTAKFSIVAPIKRNRASTTSRVVMLVFRERLIVSTRLVLTTISKCGLTPILRFSRILSKMTTVLLTL